MDNINEKLLGSLYGMACGDALGVPSSFLTQKQVEEKYGWIDTFYPPEKGHIFHDGLKAGEYTDDTEQAMAIMNSFIANRCVVPKDVVDEIMKWAERVKDKYASPLGPSTERALKAIQNGADISQSGKYANTNGSAMRISPVGIIYGIRMAKGFQVSMEEFVRDVYMTCVPTHNTKVCVSSAAAIAWGVAVAIGSDTDINEIIDEMIKAAIAGEAYGNPFVAPSISKRIAVICDMVRKEKDVKTAMAKIYEAFGGGDVAADSIPVSAGLLLLGKGNVKNVLEYAVNFGGDCDTNAAMAGAIAGAMSGICEVPEEWVRTINEVNQIDFEKFIEPMIETAMNWVGATEEECRKYF